VTIGKISAILKIFQNCVFFFTFCLFLYFLELNAEHSYIYFLFLLFCFFLQFSFDAVNIQAVKVQNYVFFILFVCSLIFGIK